MAGHTRTLVVKIAERCNLNCRYCYLYQHEDTTFRLRPKMVTDEVFEQTLVRARQYCEKSGGKMSLCFHGGEPTLVGVERFAHLADRARTVLGNRLGNLVLQTNATLLDERWVEMVIRKRIAVSVSIDGPPAIHDSARVDHAGRGSHDRTVRGIELLQRAGYQPQALCVVQPGQSGLDAYRHLRSLGITRMDFLLPDVSHDNKERFYPGLGATPVADYLIPVFDAWLDEDDPTVLVSVFRDLIYQIWGGRAHTDAFGNPPISYLVVETDGTIRASDALRVCAEGIDSSGLTVFSHGFDELAEGLPLVQAAVERGLPLSAQCRRCPEASVCGGGYLPHRYSKARGFDNPSVWCSDILSLLGHIRGALAAAGRTTVR